MTHSETKISNFLLTVNEIDWNEMRCSPSVMINVDNAISMKSYIICKTNEACSMQVDMI